MDEPDFRSLLAGAGCTACGASVRGDDVRLLAERENIAFLELVCANCGSRTLGIAVSPPDDPAGTQVMDVGGYGEFGTVDEARLATAPPIGEDDVLAVRDFLAAYRGDLRGLVERDGR